MDLARERVGHKKRWIERSERAEKYGVGVKEKRGHDIKVEWGKERGGWW